MAVSGLVVVVTLTWLSLLLQVVDSKKKYAVYFDPKNSQEYRNPKGSGFVPIGPDEWHEVVSIYSTQYCPIPSLKLVYRLNI